jgi:predicted Zn-dependent protease
MSTPRKATATALLLSLCLPAAACTPRMLTVAEERQIGEANQQAIRQQNLLLRDRVIVTYVRKLGAELAKAAPPSPYDLRFYVVESDDIGAFAIAGGSIYVNTGTILKAQNRAELAGVMAHEIGHVTQRHIIQNFQKIQKANFFQRMFATIIGLVTGNPYALNTGDLLIGIGGATYTASFSRDYEREADNVGVETLIRADYDPERLASFFETLMKEEPKSGIPQFLSTHPATPERIQNVRALIAAAPKLGDRRTEDEKLAAIQKRIKLIQGMGNDPDDEADDEADDAGDEADDDAPAPKKSSDEAKP